MHLAKRAAPPRVFCWVFRLLSSADVDRLAFDAQALASSIRCEEWRCTVVIRDQQDASRMAEAIRASLQSLAPRLLPRETVPVSGGMKY